MTPEPNYNNYTKEQLINEIKKFSQKTNKYGLVWENDKVREQIITDCKNKFPVFTEIKEKKCPPIGMPHHPEGGTDGITSKTPPSGAGGLTHILIEGDNYHALTALNYTHAGKIDVIYIDPPYNTGNKDFVYNDRFVDKEDAYRHSKWLSFMAARLELAKNLLKDTGVIFISIDDNEQANLKLLCDRIFGENNFIANMIWNSSTGGGIRSKYFNNCHEYIYCYANNIQNLPTFYATLSDEAIKQYNKQDDKGLYREKDFAWKNSSNNPNQKYLIQCPDESFVQPPKGYLFRFIKETFEQNLRNGTVVFKKTNTSPLIDENGVKAKWNIYIKKYFGDGKGAPTSVLPKGRVPLSNNGTAVIQDMFENRVFNNSKPVELLTYILELNNKENSIILDFFAGSGTTMHAVMQLNAEDGGQRQCILVTNNENQICENVTYPRCQKVITGYTTPKGQTVKGLTNNNLRYFKTMFVENSNNPDQVKFELTESCTELLCLRENVFELYKATQDYKIFSDTTLTTGLKYVAIYYDFPSRSLQNLANELAVLQGEKKLYYFSLDGNSKPDINFENLGVTIEPIPQKIIETYQNLMRK